MRRKRLGVFPLPHDFARCAIIGGHPMIVLGVASWIDDDQMIGHQGEPLIPQVMFFMLASDRILTFQRLFLSAVRCSGEYRSLQGQKHVRPQSSEWCGHRLPPSPL